MCVCVYIAISRMQGRLQKLLQITLLPFCCYPLEPHALLEMARNLA